MTVLADTRATHLVSTSGVHRSAGVAIFAATQPTGMFASPHCRGTSRTDDGKRMSINVERIAGNMLIRYVEDIAEPHRVA